MANQSGGGDDKKKKGPAFNEMILGGMRSRSGTETTKWINNLTSENMEEIAQAEVEATSVQNALPAQFAHPSISQTQVKWVDKLFDLFQQYEVEFNRAVNDPDLRIESERPVITPDLISKMQGSDHHHYIGRLHTKSWSLAVIGNLSRISGYIIPSDHYIGFQNNIASYTQFFEFVPVWDGELKWSFERGAVSISQLPAIAKQIFGQLVRVAKGEAEASERFGAAPTPARQAQLASSQGTKISELAQTNNQSDSLGRHSSVFDDNEPLTHSPHGFASAEPPAHRQSSALAPAASNPTDAASLPRQVQARNVPNSSEDVDLNSAFDQLISAMGRELENLSRAGAKAFENHEFTAVERLMKRTAKFKSMHDQMLATVQQWKRDLDSEQ
jgi:hypothetical protein